MLKFKDLPGTLNRLFLVASNSREDLNIQKLASYALYRSIVTLPAMSRFWWSNEGSQGNSNSNSIAISISSSSISISRSRSSSGSSSSGISGSRSSGSSGSRSSVSTFSFLLVISLVAVHKSIIILILMSASIAHVAVAPKGGVFLLGLMISLILAMN